MNPSRAVCVFFPRVSPLTRTAALATLMVALSGAVSPAINVSVSPTSIVWNTTTWVGLTVTGITAGAAVDLRLYVDVNGDRSVDTNDVWLTEIRVTDGITNAWGASMLACDTNGAADGRIYTRVSYHGLASEAQLWHAVGNYIWEARLTNGAAAAAPFVVSQPTSTIWLAGTVCALTNLSPVAGQPLGGALVTLEYYSLLDGQSPATWTDTNGAFRLYLPAGVSTGNVRVVSAVAAGYLMAEQGPGGEPLSSLSLPDALSVGANTLPQPLYVIPPIPGTLYVISGRVTDDAGRAVCAALVQTDIEDSDMFAAAITDTDGNYRFPLPPPDRPVTVYSADHLINLRGLVGTATQLVDVTSDVTGVGLCLPRATGLIRGALLTDGAAGGIQGALVEVSGSQYGSFSYTFGTGGVFELGSIGGTNMKAEIDSDSLRPDRRIPVPYRLSSLTLPDTGIYTDLVFRAVSVPVISGSVYDTQTNAIWGGGVSANFTNDWESADEVYVDLCGRYALLVPNDTYWVHTWDFGDFGYSDATYPDAVTVAGGDVGPVDIYLQQIGWIEGTVRGNGEPVTNASVEAHVITFENGSDVSWGWSTSTRTGTDGNYALRVPPGSDYRVRARRPDGSLWLEQWYNHAASVTGSTPVEATAGTSTTNINFDLEIGAIISGTVRGGGNPLSNIQVQAHFTWTNDVGEWQWGDFVDNANTGTNGSYTLVVPSDRDYEVRASPPDGVPWVQQFFDHVGDHDDLTPVHPTTNTPADGVDFDLEEAALIRGNVSAGGYPLENAQVHALLLWLDEEEDINGWYEAAHATTDESGDYTLMVQTGAVYAVAAEGEDASPWIYQIYSNVTDLAYAIRLSPSVGVPIEGIDFILVEGGRIGGHISDAATGDPLAWIPVTVFHEDSEGSYYYAVSDGESTETGDYWLHVPEGSNYIVQAGGDGRWVEQVFEGTRDWSAARPVTATIGDAVTNVDFALTAGLTIRGCVTDRHGDGMSLPIEVGVVDAAGQWTWRWGTRSDGSGDYQCMMEAGTSHVVRIDCPGYPVVYFDRTLTASNATRLAGPRGADLDSVDFQLFSSTDDSDEDGTTDDVEAYVMHSDPWDDQDHLEWLGIVFTNGKTLLTWRAEPVTPYLLERTTNLLNVGGWTNLTPSPILTNAPEAAYLDQLSPSGGIYRIRVPY